MPEHLTADVIEGAGGIVERSEREGGEFQEKRAES
jgi:hypothetical protein